MGGSRDPAHIQELIDALEELQQVRCLRAAFSTDPSDFNLAWIQAYLRIQANAIRGSAYPHQIKRRILQVQAPFEDWFREKAGIGPKRALEIIDGFEIVVNQNLAKSRERFQCIFDRMSRFVAQASEKPLSQAALRQFEDERHALGKETDNFLQDAPLDFWPSFHQLSRTMPDLRRCEWDALRNLIGLTSASRHQVGNPLEIRARPLYFLGEDRVAMLDASAVYDAVFGAFDSLTRNHADGFRDKKYVPSLSEWTEREIRGYFERVFPERCVFHQLCYPDPDHPGGEAELDGAILWGPFLLLVEIKGKQFRSRSQLGDPARLRDDLKHNVEEAWQQASRAKRYIEANAVAELREKTTGRILRIRSDNVKRTFLISVTLHHLAGLATQLTALAKTGLFNSSAYPWSLSLADLDVITTFAKNPDVFVHYIERRLDLQQSEKRVLTSELELFGLYLDCRLYPGDFWERKLEDGRSPGLLLMLGGADKFDSWLNAQMGLCPQPEISLNLPRRFSAILDQLRARDDDHSRWIAFALLSLSPAAVSRVEETIPALGSASRADGRIARVTFSESDTAVSILTARAMSIQELAKQAGFRAQLEKYRLKVQKSIVLAFDVARRSDQFQVAVWLEAPWTFDPLLEKVLAEERPKLPPGLQPPKRNDPCFCGSRIKFKKCCMNKLARTTLSHERASSK